MTDFIHFIETDFIQFIEEMGKGVIELTLEWWTLWNIF